MSDGYGNSRVVKIAKGAELNRMKHAVSHQVVADLLHELGYSLQANVHDFIDKELGRATPYGIYDIGRNAGWVSVGVDHDTAEFAVESIRRWWRSMGRDAYPKATRLPITADSGGSNGSRLRLWKLELQKLADETRLRIAVCHFPPGTSKWNKIEHRLFSFIAQNWRGKPLTSLQVIVSWIAHDHSHRPESAF